MRYLWRTDNNAGLRNRSEELAARHPTNIVQVEKLERLEQQRIIADLMGSLEAQLVEEILLKAVLTCTSYRSITDM